MSTVFGSAFLRAGDTEYDLSARYAEETRELLPLLEPALGQALRLHLRAVMRQVAVGESERASGRLPGADRPVGRVRRPHRLHAARRERATRTSWARWRNASRELASDLVEPPVRLVKTIGDAVMLVSPDTDALLSMLLELNDAAEAGDSGLPRHPRRHWPAAPRWAAAATCTARP